MPTKAVVVLNGELVKGTLWFDQEVFNAMQFLQIEIICAKI